MGQSSSAVSTVDPAESKMSKDGFVHPKDRGRGCTDCLCLMLLLASWLAMTIVGFAAIGIIEYKYVKKGDPIRLLHPFDYAGQVCGYDSEVKSKPLGYYMSTGALVCVSECPKTTDMDTFYCYDDAQSVLDPLYTSNYALYTTTAWNYVTDGKCMYAVESTNVAYRCVMSEAQEVVELAVQSATNNNVPLSYSSAENAGGWFTRYIGDILTLKDYVFGFGLGVSVGISFLYLYFLRLPGLLFAVIWSCVLSIEGVFVVATILLHDLYRSWEDGGVKPSNEILVIKVFFWICLGISALYFCLVLVLRKRIMLAIGIIKEAGRALATMPSVIFLPVLQSAGMVAFIVPWFIYMLYLGSSGTIVNVTVYNDYSQTSVTYRKFEYDEYTKYAMIYMLFCWFWTSQFIIALGQLSLAMCIVCWYFTKDKSTIGNGTVFWATRYSMMYNSGTAAFGSLIIAIIATLRVVLAYIQRKCSLHKNKVTEAIICCIGCCLWCFEKCVKFLNKNAYIQTAIYGYSFCKAARTAFFLLLRNILRVAAVNMVSGFVIMLGKIMIPSMTTLACYLCIIYANKELTEEITGIIAPMVTVFLLSYFVACKFNELFDMTIETILLCYIADEEMFPPEERYAEGSLQEAVSSTSEAAKASGVHKDEEAPSPEKEIEVVDAQ